MNTQFTGTVSEMKGNLRKVELYGAPNHLKVMFLTSIELGSAKEGDKVVITHWKGAGYSHWRVKQILKNGYRICAWCGDFLGELPEFPSGVISHGICKSCSDSM